MIQVRIHAWLSFISEQRSRKLALKTLQRHALSDSDVLRKAMDLVEIASAALETGKFEDLGKALQLQRKRPDSFLNPSVRQTVERAR